MSETTETTETAKDERTLLTVRLTGAEQMSLFKDGSAAAGFSSMSEWARVTLTKAARAALTEAATAAGARS